MKNSPRGLPRFLHLSPEESETIRLATIAEARIILAKAAGAPDDFDLVCELQEAVSRLALLTLRTPIEASATTISTTH